MDCAEYLVDFLIKKGVTDVFGYAGGYIVPFMDALYKRKNEIKIHVCYNEQGCAFFCGLDMREQAVSWGFILLLPVQGL